MSLGLPSHLSRAANSKALAAAARWAALVCLVMAVVNVVISTVGGTIGAASWISTLVLVPMILLLLLLARGRTVVLTVAYLLVGAACTFLYVYLLFESTPAYRDTNLFVVALPVVAMTLVGGTGTGALAGILWATLGFALAEAAVLVGATAAGRDFRPDAISLGAYLLLVGVLAFDGLTRGSRSRTQSAIHRAVRDARLVDLRRELLAESTADLHDTVLSELAAITATEPGELPPRLRARIESDLRALGGAALPAESEPPAGQVDEPWYESELRRAIEDARDEGLAVDVSGDRDAVARLADDSRRAVGLAVRQCLVNVLRHSGSATAEVAVSSGDGSVSVMVVDGGRGFAVASAGADRLGLRQSVHDRISKVGGTVTIYSSEDVGTTVIMTLPTVESA
ncbi:ATP-binding protein [Leifsonia shinshuensis]|uniref:sensor histidine kinase n=1 Tax=Leifsonia shinshuensis TaxID=150026 RepID=UPI001F50B2B8|nr:ATP-binding protein [Leifsonia shinshuensis]MCI0157342.1 ATP-binding protein [Leifsonia shinshuensis]